jgi:peptidylprolyl isomerase
MWKTLSYKLTLTLQYLDNQRFKLQPVFNLDDTTELEIAKAERGEKLLENLRERLVALNSSILDHNKTSTLLDQQAALRALSEVGEMLVESYPFNVPDQGKFSYLPRLLGRAKVTFTWARPWMNTPYGRNQIPLLDPTSTTTSLLTYKEQILGNVTILVDGFIAPITAGNFVDLSIRGFYTDLPVKFMRKRLGVNPSLTLPGADSSNLVVYDIADTLDKIKAMDDSSMGVDKDSWVISDMPIFGSFGEGFYDPLTAKPRRIPFEVVQYDRSSGKTTLSYSSAALDSPNQMFTQVSSDKGRWWSGITSSGDMPSSTRDSQNSIVLNFNIPGLVTMNHPDRNLNGGSSEFFVLHERDRIDERTRLLNGSYAPFGYVLDGLDILQSLQPGDVIRSTHVDEWGKLNLVKIRTLSLTQGIS